MALSYSCVCGGLCSRFGGLGVYVCQVLQIDCVSIESMEPGTPHHPGKASISTSSSGTQSWKQEPSLVLLCSHKHPSFPFAGLYLPLTECKSCSYNTFCLEQISLLSYPRSHRLLEQRLLLYIYTTVKKFGVRHMCFLIIN